MLEEDIHSGDDSGAGGNAKAGLLQDQRLKIKVNSSSDDITFGRMSTWTFYSTQDTFSLLTMFPYHLAKNNCKQKTSGSDTPLNAILLVGSGPSVDEFEAQICISPQDSLA